MSTSENPDRLQEVEIQVPGVPGVHAAKDSGDRWNGAVCPLFEQEQAEDFAEVFSESSPEREAWYDKDQDAFCFDSPERGEPECFPSVERDGREYYPIGAWCWMWMEA